MTEIVVVCGLTAEAKIAAGPDVTVIAGGGDRYGLEAALDRAASTAHAFVSFGVAGGLAPHLSPGDVLVADTVVGPGGRRFATDPAWSARIAGALRAPRAVFLGVDAPVAGVADKAALRQAVDAAVVDMESHIVGETAARFGKRFAAVRVVTDPAARSLPHAATVGMRADGKVDLRAIFMSLMSNPGQLPSLIRTGLDARAAFSALLRCRQRLGPGFAFLDLG